MVAIVYGLFGFLVGLLINVLADDLPLREKPRIPHCAECEAQFKPLFWSGLVRRLFGRGRCPACGVRESWRPALVEAGATLVFVLMWLRYRQLSAELVIYSLYLAIFVLIFVTDVEHRLILHVVTFPALLFALLASFFTVTPLAALLGALAGFVFFLLVYLLGERFFGSGAMGFGDVTLATVIGAMLGFPMVAIGLLVGIVTGGVIAGGLLLFRMRQMRSKVPYGPFLIAGGVATLLWGPQITAWLFR